MKRFGAISVISWLLAALFSSNVLADSADTNQMRAVVDTNTVQITSGERALMRYRYRDVPFKPYVKELFTPGGVNVLLDAPADHLHHHALMFAVTADGTDFWGEQSATGEPGQQLHRLLGDIQVDTRQDVPLAGFSQLLDWKNPRSTELLLKEHRTIEVCHLKEPDVALLTWQSEFEAPDGKESVTLTGSHYQGLGMRFIRSMDKAGEFYNADGTPGTIFRGEERLVRSRWCAYTAQADGKDVTVAMFDHPANERYPATWFTMKEPFAYLSATLALHEPAVGGLKLEPGKPLVLRYAVALWDGKAKTDEIEKVHKFWAAFPRDTIQQPETQQTK